MNAPENSLPPPIAREMAENLGRRLEAIFPVEHWPDSPIIVGVSGGADSVALLRLMTAKIRAENLSTPLLVSHINHGTRGAESLADAEWVTRLAQAWGWEAVVSTLPTRTPGRDRVVSEDQLRRQRYSVWKSLALERGARYVLTAHHADDQLETLLFRLLRGTSLKGATGIPAVRLLDANVTLVRPLLNIRRRELKHFLDLCSQEHRVDHSNLSTVYTRNRIRHEVIPVLEAVAGEIVSDHLLRFQVQTREVQNFLEQTAQRELGPHTERSPCGGWQLDRAGWKGAAPVLRRVWLRQLWELAEWPLRDYSQSVWNEVEQWIVGDDSAPRRDFPGPIFGLRQPDRVLFNAPQNLLPHSN